MESKVVVKCKVEVYWSVHTVMKSEKDGHRGLIACARISLRLRYSTSNLRLLDMDSVHDDKDAPNLVNTKPG